MMTHMWNSDCHKRYIKTKKTIFPIITIIWNDKQAVLPTNAAPEVLMQSSWLQGIYLIDIYRPKTETPILMSDIPTQSVEEGMK